MNIYWVIIEVNFKEPMSSEEAPDAMGFFQTFGCTESTDAIMEETIKSRISSEKLAETYTSEIDFDISIIEPEDVEQEVLMDNEINQYIKSSPFDKGIWYQSGKAFFHDEENNNEMHVVEVVPKDAH